MVRVCMLGMIAVLLATQLKTVKSEYALYISIATCILIFYFGLNKIEVVLEAIKKIESYLTINHTYIVILIKIIGITYLSEFSANLCKDSGHNAIANQIELVGKLTIISMGMPVLMALLDTINQFLTA